MAEKRIIRVVLRRLPPPPPEDPPPATDDPARLPFILKDIFYRCELARARHLRGGSIFGAGLVLLAFVAWYLLWSSGLDWGLFASAAPAYASLGLCAAAFLLGVRSVQQERTGDTADALVMTRASRRRILRAKALAAIEPVILPALLLGVFYFLAMPSLRGPFAQVDTLHGGLLRLESVGPLPEKEYFAYVGWTGDLQADAVVACGAVLSDFSWYYFCAALGICAAVRPLRGAAFLMLGIGVVLFVGTFIEGHVSNALLIDGVSKPEVWGWAHYDYDLGLFRGWMATNGALVLREGQGLLGAASFLWAVMIMLRCLLAAWLLRRAARRFDLYIARD
jgi:hypothetical protein